MIFRLVSLAALSIRGRSRCQVYTLFIHLVRKNENTIHFALTHSLYTSQHTHQLDLIVLEFSIIITVTEYGSV